MAIADLAENPPPILEVEDRLSSVTGAPPSLLDPSDPHPPPLTNIHKSEVNDGPPKHVHTLGPDDPSRAIDNHAQFWSTYDKAADSYDKELLDAWNKSLDVLLIFAGLFSAINTAFIIESYRGLQPDPAETTNALLRLSITHRNDNITLSLDDLVPPAPSAIPINSIFFSSLSFSLTAAFGAVTAKQWLTEFANVGIMKALHVQGKRRQEKFRGLKTWHFRLIIELLPMLLQISLLLFLVGVVQFLWTIDKTVAVGQLVLSAAGLAIYIVTIIIGIVVPTSPFQTPLSRHLPRFFSRINRSLNIFIESHHLNSSMTTLFNSLGVTDMVTHVRSILEPHTSVFIRLIRNTQSRYGSTSVKGHIEVMQWDRAEFVAAEAVVWLLEQAEHPDVTITALDVVPRLSPKLVLSLVQQREGLLERLIRFHYSLLPPRTSLQWGDEWIKTWPNSVIVSGVALYHILKSQRFECQDVLLDPLIQSLEAGVSFFYSEIEDPIVLIQYLVFNNVCSPAGGNSNLLRSLKYQLALLGSSPLIPIEPMDVRQGPAGSSIIASISQVELVLDFILRVAWTNKFYTPYGDTGHMMPQLLSTLLQLPLSSNAVSHVAITFAVVCWSLKCDNPWSYPTEVDQRQLEILLMDRCLAVDKSKNLLENIALALSMIDVSKPDAFTRPRPDSMDVEPDLTAPILYSLIKIAIPLLKAEYSRNDIPYSNFAQGLLRLSRKVHPATETIRYDIAMLLTRCPNGDWVLPTGDEYGENIIRLLDGLLFGIIQDNFGHTPEMLLNMMAQVSDDTQFLTIIDSPIWIYPYHKGVTTSIYPPYEFIQRTLMLHRQSSSRPLELLDTQISFAAVSLESDWMFRSVCDFFNRIVQEDSDLHWPAYFIDAGIVQSNAFSDAEPAVLVKSIDPIIELQRSWTQGDHNMKEGWCGEALMMLWRIGRRESVKGNLPSDWNDSSIFSYNTVRIMKKYFRYTRIHAYVGVDWDLVKEYFSRALATMQNEGYIVKTTRDLHEQEHIGDIENIVQELGDCSNDHPPPPRIINSS